MIFTLFITCIFGLGALQPSCAAPRSDEIQVVESKIRLNEVSYTGFDNYSITNLGFSVSDLYNLFNTYDSGYLPWQYDSQIRTFYNNLNNFAWGSAGSTGVYSNRFHTEFLGKIGVLYNYDLHYDYTKPITSTRDEACLSYVTKIRFDVTKFTHYNAVANNYVALQYNYPFYDFEITYYIDSDILYYQRFNIVLPNSYQHDFKIFSVVGNNSDYFVNLGVLSNNRNQSYIGTFPLSPLSTNSYITESLFSFMLLNSNNNGAFISNGFDGTSSSLDNFVFSMHSNIPYYYGLNVGLDQYSDGAITDAYNNGYNRGYVNGRSTKDLEVYDEAFEEGYDQGVIRGQEIASDPASEIYETIFNAGKQEGITEGYNSASADSGVPAMIFSGILSVALIPVNVFIQMFQYEIFGINVAGLISGLITIAMVIIIVRFLLGGKTDDK